MGDTRFESKLSTSGHNSIQAGLGDKFTPCAVIVVVISLCVIVSIPSHDGFSDGSFIISSVSADLEEMHGDDDILENRMIIPFHSGGIKQADTSSSPSSSS
ncbi:MAG: hypothetical protein GEU26_07550 [Nitrososphaeraceae archaeon]|nr:hypothetical protein [Nitrososphaeraceae archaeon]